MFLCFEHSQPNVPPIRLKNHLQFGTSEDGDVNDGRRSTKVVRSVSESIVISEVKESCQELMNGLRTILAAHLEKLPSMLT